MGYQGFVLLFDGRERPAPTVEGTVGAGRSRPSKRRTVSSVSTALNRLYPPIGYVLRSGPLVNLMLS